MTEETEMIEDLNVDNSSYNHPKTKNVEFSMKKTRKKSLIDCSKGLIAYLLFTITFIIIHELSHYLCCYFLNVKVVFVKFRISSFFGITFYGMGIVEDNPEKKVVVALCGSFGSCLILSLLIIYSRLKKKDILSIFITTSLFFEFLNWLIGYYLIFGDAKILIDYGYVSFAKLILFSIGLLFFISFTLSYFTYKEVNR